MISDIIAVFMIGLLGGFSHCIGMCGGFVLTYSVKIQGATVGNRGIFRERIAPHLLYSAGRILSYMLLGELFGLLGGTIHVVFAIRPVQGALQLLAGIVMMVIGLDLAGWIPGWQPDAFPGFSQYKKLVQALFNKVNRNNILGLGFVLGFIPCGLVYAAGAYAVASASLINGMLIMMTFGLGTVPAMAFFGMAAQKLSQSMRSVLYRIAAWLVIVLGILTILRGLDALGVWSISWLF